MRKSLIAALLVMLLLPGAPTAHGDTPTLTGKPALREGARGGTVRSLQTMLALAGFTPGSQDGIFGPATATAVRTAQAHFGLQVDGIVGPATAGALQTVATRQAAVQTAQVPVPTESPRAAKSGTRISTQPLLPEDRPAFRQLVLFTADDGATVSEVAKPEKGSFALTFHGGPDPDLTPALLDLLAAYGAKATFFIHGEAAIGRPELVAQIVAAGHEIGNYGMRYQEMTRLSSASLQADLLQATAAIRAVAGVQPAFFRPPGGGMHLRMQQAAEQIGLKMVMWTNIGARDRGALTAAELVPRLQESLFSGAVLMLHADRPLMLEALPALLEKAQEDGLRSLTLTEMQGLP